MTLDDFACLATLVAVPAFILALPYILSFFGY